MLAATSALKQGSEGLAKHDRTRPTFASTPFGRSAALAYDFSAAESDRHHRADQELGEIGWLWVMSGESLATKANLQECLVRTRKARAVIARYSSDYEKALSNLLAQMDAELGKVADQVEVWKRTKAEMVKPDGSVGLSRQFFRSMSEYIDLTEQMVKFLIPRFGKYTVSGDSVEFGSQVSPADVDRYNSLHDRWEAAQKSGKEALRRRSLGG